MSDEILTRAVNYPPRLEHVTVDRATAHKRSGNNASILQQSQMEVWGAFFGSIFALGLNGNMFKKRMMRPIGTG